MKLLKLRIDGVTLFKDKRLELDFIASDRVSRDEEGNVADVFPLPVGSSIYSQNVMGVVGVNASGKTTTLNLVRFVLGYMSGSFVMRRFATGSDVLGNLERQVNVACVFFEKGSVYLIESRLRKVDDVTAEDTSFAESLAFENEWLWRCPVSRVSRKVVLNIERLKDVSEPILVREGPDGGNLVLVGNT